MSTHDLKIWPGFFSMVLTETKTFEIRKNDRGYCVGDRLILREFDPDTQSYTGRVLSRVVTVLSDYEQKPGFIVLGIAP